MCDKLQTSKDGSVDLCHGRLAEYGSPRSVQQYSSSSNSITSSSNRKQRKHYGKDKSSHYLWSDSDKPLSFPNWRGFRSHQDKHGRKISPGQGSSSRETERIKGPDVSAGSLPKEGADGGRKKASPLSLNHLLNFTVTPSEKCYSGHSGRGGMPPIIRHRKRNTSHSYNKEEFLQANCQFVVSASGDYAVHSGDPDTLVEWECIEQVRLFCHDIPSCPICLYPPRAAKITRCGHVYCWSCLLHYLSLREMKWSKCPICNESIYRRDIKSVAALSTPQYGVADTISMKLMVREKGSTEVSTRVDWDSKKNHGMLTVEDSCVNQFVKLVSATPAQVLSLITGQERRTLESQLSELVREDASEQCFIEAALHDLKVRESELTRAQTVCLEVEKMITDLAVSMAADRPASPSDFDPSHKTWTSFSDQYFEGGFEDPFLNVGETSTDSIQSLEDSKGEREMEKLTDIDGIPDVLGEAALSSKSSPQSCSSESSSLSDDVLPNQPSKGDLLSSKSSPQSCSSESCSLSDDVVPSLPSKGDLIYFYQASDGQHLYMHPINVKCLLREYGGLEHCPDEITATVVEIEQFTMSEEVRGRYKSLNHLPLTCELALCELELKAPVLSKDTLECFALEIARRRLKRVKKKKDERRREKRAEAKNLLYEPTFRVPSALELTPEKFHDFLSLASSPSLLESEPPQASNHSVWARESESAQVVAGNPSPPSFAQALQGNIPTWPVKVSPKDPQVAVHATNAREKDELPVPSFQDAFQEASESVLAAHKAPGGKPGSKTAKKGRKKLVLFSTGGSRGAN